MSEVPLCGALRCLKAEVDDSLTASESELEASHARGARFEPVNFAKLTGMPVGDWHRCRESRRRSRDTYPETYITKHTSVRRKIAPGYEAGPKIQSAKLQTLNPNPERCRGDLIVEEAELGGRGH